MPEFEIEEDFREMFARIHRNDVGCFYDEDESEPDMISAVDSAASLR